MFCSSHVLFINFTMLIFSNFAKSPSLIRDNSESQMEPLRFFTKPKKKKPITFQFFENCIRQQITDRVKGSWAMVRQDAYFSIRGARIPETSMCWQHIARSLKPDLILPC